MLMLLKQNKSHIVDGRNDDDCNFLNCKFKGSNLTFISSWRVLSAPTGPYQALNPKWTITKEEIYRGRNFHSFTHYLTRLLLPPFGTKPLHAEQNYYSSRVLFWMMGDQPKGGTQDVDPGQLTAHRQDPLFQALSRVVVMDMMSDPSWQKIEDHFKKKFCLCLSLAKSSYNVRSVCPVSHL